MNGAAIMMRLCVLLCLCDGLCPAADTIITGEDAANGVVADDGKGHGRLAWLTDLDRWDSRHQFYSSRFTSTIDGIDRFFGDERLIEDNQRSRLTLGIGLRLDRNDGLSLVSGLRLRLVMPRLEQRLQLVLDDDLGVDEPGDEQALIDAVRETRPDAGVRYIFKEEERMRISGDIGVRTSDPFQLFGRGRWRMTIPFDYWELRLSETVYWFTEDGWLETTDMSWSRPVTGLWLFRSSSSLRWEELRHGITPGQAFSLTHPLSFRRAFRFYISGTWPESPHTREANYVFGAVYRQRIHRDWLFMEISPSLEFPQADDYAINPIVELKFEIILSSND